jgi:hypothetical protein
MPQTSKALFRGAATTTTTTLLYTVPASTTTVVTDIVVTNTAGAVGSFTIALNDVSIATLVTVVAIDTSLSDIVNEPTAPAVLVTTMSVTTVVVDAGTV